MRIKHFVTCAIMIMILACMSMPGFANSGEVAPLDRALAERLADTFNENLTAKLQDLNAQGIPSNSVEGRTALMDVLTAAFEDEGYNMNATLLEYCKRSSPEFWNKAHQSRMTYIIQVPFDMLKLPDQREFLLTKGYVSPETVAAFDIMQAQ